MSIDNVLLTAGVDSEDAEEDITITNRSTNENKEEKKPSTEDILEVEKEETNCLIDALHLLMLQLMEEQVNQNLQLKTHTSRGFLILARVRLQHGTLRQTASTTQLSRTKTYRALCRLVEQAESWGKSLKLHRYGVDIANGFLDPLTHIFGRLVPYSLRMASRKWERCVDQIVECVNVQRELQSVYRSIERLKWSSHSRRSDV